MNKYVRFSLLFFLIFEIMVGMSYQIVKAEEILNLGFIRDIIGGMETGGNSFPSDALGQDQEIGVFQIKPTTAKFLQSINKIPQTPTNKELVTNLFDPDFNGMVALEILKYCKTRLPYRLKNEVREIAYCYTAGPNSKFGENLRKKNYAKNVASIYAYYHRLGNARTYLTVQK